MYLFAKEVSGLNWTGGSNPPVSASLKLGFGGQDPQIIFGEMAERLKAAVY